MNTEIKAKWVEALRSGKYEQGKSRLQNCLKQTYCCLGVLCEISPNVQKYGSGYIFANTAMHAILTGAFRLQVGLKESQESDLANLNDLEGRSFLEIADYIEKNL